MGHVGHVGTHLCNVMESVLRPHTSPRSGAPDLTSSGPAPDEAYYILSLPRRADAMEGTARG